MTLSAVEIGNIAVYNKFLPRNHFTCTLFGTPHWGDAAATCKMAELLLAVMHERALKRERRFRDRLGVARNTCNIIHSLCHFLPSEIPDTGCDFGTKFSPSSLLPLSM